MGSKDPEWDKGDRWDEDDLQTMVLYDIDRDLMGMGVCLCMGVRVSLGDGGSVGSQGKRAAAMAWGRPRRSSVPVPPWR